MMGILGFVNVSFGGFMSTHLDKRQENNKASHRCSSGATTMSTK
jgi:hypothetical protein